MSSTENDSISLSLSLTSVPSAARVSISVPKKATAPEFREIASNATSIPLAAVKLIYRGRLIADNAGGDVVSEFKLEDGSVVHVMGKPVSADDSSTAAVVAPSSAGPSFTLPHTAVASEDGSGGGLDGALTKLKSSADYQTALTTLEKILAKIISNPLEDKFRKVKRDNAAFQRRLGGLLGGHDAMIAVGFDLVGEEYVMKASAEGWTKLLEAKAGVSSALVEAQRSTTAMPNPGTGGGISGDGLANMPGVAGAMSPDRNASTMMTNMMRNPQALQNMLQNPMVQNILQNDARFANNPMLRQSLDAMSSNPQMMEQMSRMMNDPVMRGRMNQMAQRGGMDPQASLSQMPPRMSQQSTTTSGIAAGTTASAPPSVQQQPPSSNNHQNTSDRELTEEEMIAEAIARSLREN